MLAIASYLGRWYTYVLVYVYSFTTLPKIDNFGSDHTKRRVEVK